MAKKPPTLNLEALAAEVLSENLLDESPGTLGFEMEMPTAQPAVTDSYIYISLTKYWTGVNLRTGPDKRDEIRAGFNLEPPVGRELVIAIPRPGHEASAEPLLEGTIHIEEFLKLQQRVIETNLAIESITRQSSKGF